MKGSIIGLGLFLLVTSAWAGTFTDNFDDGNLDGWTVILQFGQGGSWKIEDGELVGQALNGPIQVWIGEETWTDYTVSVKVKITAHQPDERFVESAGITMRTAAPMRTYVLTLGMGGGFGNTKQVNAFYVTGGIPQHFEFSPFDWKLNTWYEMKVTAEGKKFKVYVDDEPVLDYVDATFRAGQVGLNIGFLGTTAHFDDFSVTGDDVPGTVMSIDPKAKLATAWAVVKGGK